MERMLSPRLGIMIQMEMMVGGFKGESVILCSPSVGGMERMLQML
jgi:hypothetical protein